MSDPNLTIRLTSADGTLLASGEHDVGPYAPAAGSWGVNLRCFSGDLRSALGHVLGNDAVMSGLQLEITSRGPK